MRGRGRVRSAPCRAVCGPGPGSPLATLVVILLVDRRRAAPVLPAIRRDLEQPRSLPYDGRGPYQLTVVREGYDLGLLFLEPEYTLYLGRTRASPRTATTSRSRKDAGKTFLLAAAQAKLKTGRLAVRAAEEAVQIHGGYGYIEEYPVCRFYRDAKILTIGEGTDEIQQMVIARQLGL